MPIEILRLGSRGASVTRWQNFLIGQGHLRQAAGGEFDAATDAATRAFQRSQGIAADGIVGPNTLGRALSAGFDAGFVDRVDPATNPVLVGSSGLNPVSDTARKQMFGSFDFEPAPTSANPEAIRILGDWEQKNITSVFLPQLKGVPLFTLGGEPCSGNVRFHVKAAAQLKNLWAAWEESGMVKRVLTYSGSFVPRFIRGSRTTLSNHAYGSAFDINAEWNGLGAVPALEGRQGSVRELAAIANEHGFYWGGHFNKRPDGMHFEVARLL